MQIAQELDAAEKAFMAEGGVDSEEFRSFMAEDSGNVSSDGFFSIQVLVHESSHSNMHTEPEHSRTLLCAWVRLRCIHLCR